MSMVNKINHKIFLILFHSDEKFDQARKFKQAIQELIKVIIK